MAQRIRTIKPDFFVHEGLSDLGIMHRLLFIGMWTLADKKGRMLDRPRRIKIAVFPYDDDITAEVVDEMLCELASHQDQFLVRYTVGDKDLIEISGFLEHQRPHHKEPESAQPAPDGKNAVIREGCILGPCLDKEVNQARPNHETMVDPSMSQAWPVLERGREGKGKEGIRKGREEGGKGKEEKKERNSEISERPQDIFGGGES